MVFITSHHMHAMPPQHEFHFEQATHKQEPQHKNVRRTLLKTAQVKPMHPQPQQATSSGIRGVDLDMPVA